MDHLFGLHYDLSMDHNQYVSKNKSLQINNSLRSPYVNNLSNRVKTNDSMQCNSIMGLNPLEKSVWESKMQFKELKKHQNIVSNRINLLESDHKAIMNQIKETKLKANQIKQKKIILAELMRQKETEQNLYALQLINQQKLNMQKKHDHQQLVKQQYMESIENKRQFKKQLKLQNEQNALQRQKSEGQMLSLKRAKSIAIKDTKMQIKNKLQKFWFNRYSQCRDGNIETIKRLDRSNRQNLQSVKMLENKEMQLLQKLEKSTQLQNLHLSKLYRVMEADVDELGPDQFQVQRKYDDQIKFRKNKSKNKIVKLPQMQLKSWDETYESEDQIQKYKNFVNKNKTSIIKQPKYFGYKL